MGKIDPGRGHLSEGTAGAKARHLRLVAGPESPQESCSAREQAVRDLRRRVGRLLRALPAADCNVSRFPDAVVTQLAQCDSVTAAFLWGHSGLDVEAVDSALVCMANIERWVRDGLDAQAQAAVRRRELQVCILDEDLRSPLILSEWSDAFVERSSGDPAAENNEFGGAIRQLALDRLCHIAQRLGLSAQLDADLPQELLRPSLERMILRTLTDPSELCVLLATLSDGARVLLAQLAGGGCEECQPNYRRELGVEDSVMVEGWSDLALGHPVQQLRDCGLVYLDPACRLRVPQGLAEPLRAALGTVSKLCSLSAAQPAGSAG